jgi:2-polyprenyl-3-methyl-5-hydroxy-6-metoxy-1,4-benzoquinol methylase
MTLTGAAAYVGVEARARQSLGASSDAILRMVAEAVERRDIRGPMVCDVGCGHGALRAVVQDRFPQYRGVDVVRYPGLSPDVEFTRVDLDSDDWPLAPGSADLVAAVETIEHLENPWAFVRRLAALTAPGGWVVVTTPNQLSVLSMLTLAIKRRFSAFQDAHYPAHRTALLESDLRRVVEASGLQVVEITYSLSGRIPLTAWHYPGAAARRWPRALSDNLMIVARKPRA